MIDHIKFAFITTPRTPVYIHRTLTSFFASSRWVDGPPVVDLVVDDGELGSLDAYRHHDRIRLRTLSPQEVSTAKNWGPHRRCCYSHWRALATGLEPHQRGLCVFEDDVVFRDGFAEKLAEVVEQIEHIRKIEGRHNRYVLACYAPCDLDRPELAGSRLFVPYGNGFYGAQALYYSRESIAGLADYLREQGVENAGCADLIIKDYCRDRAALLATRCSLVQHVGHVGTGLGEFHEAVTFERPWPSDRAVRQPVSLPASAGSVNATNAGEAAEAFLATIPAYPEEAHRGTGIVTCGGGMRYFTCAYVGIRLLRQFGCRLPIELWHLDDSEMNHAMRRLVEPLGVRCMRASDFYRQHPVRPLHGWQLKPFSIIHSRFREVLFLDADNVPVTDPGYLFHQPPYLRTGAIFWPDYGTMKPQRAIWEILGIRYRDEADFESGQMLIDKRRCWRALMLSMHFNEHRDFYYRYMWGDKDTFHLAWRMLDLDYAMPPHPPHRFTLPGHFSLAMGQHDFEGQVIFQHRNLDKWRLDGRNPTLPTFEHETACLSFLSELAERWPRKDRLGSAGVPPRPVRRIGRRFVRAPA